MSGANAPPVCLYGCDEPADFYTSGFRCDEHSPKAMRAREDGTHPEENPCS